MEYLKNKVKGLRLAIVVLVIAGCGVGRVAATDFDSAGEAIHFNTQKQLGADKYAGFYWFKNGIDVNGVGAVLGITGPIGGEIKFSTDNTLSFTRDLHLSSDAYLNMASEGKLAGTSSSTLFLGDDLTLAGNILNVPASNYLTIDGQGHKLTLSSVLAAGSDCTLTLSNMTLEPGTADKIALAAASRLILSNVVIQGSLTVNTGTVIINNLVSVHGGTFEIGSSLADFSISEGGIFYLDKKSELSYLPNDANKIMNNGWLYFDGATFSSGLGLTLTGTVLFDNQVTVSSTGIVNLTNAAVEVLSGARVAVTNGTLVH